MIFQPNKWEMASFFNNLLVILFPALFSTTVFAATSYTASPTLRQLTSGGSGIEFQVDNTPGTGTSIDDGVAWFKIQKPSGAFTTSGTMEIYEIGVSSPIATGSYTAGATATGWVRYSLPTSFTSGSRRYYTQRQGDANVNSGAITIYASTPNTPPR